MTKMLKRVLGEDISLQVNYGSSLPMIDADPGMMEQVVLNLAINARDAMPSGGQLCVATTRQSIDLEYTQLDSSHARRSRMSGRQRYGLRNFDRGPAAHL
jgi:signal transduction histidine kinase